MGTRVLIRGLSCDAHGAGSPMWPAVEVSDAHLLQVELGTVLVRVYITAWICLE